MGKPMSNATASPTLEATMSMARLAILTLRGGMGGARHACYAHPHNAPQERGCVSHVITLRVPALGAYRDLVGRAAGTVCRVAANERGESDEFLERVEHAVVSAVGEAFNNVVQHAYRGRRDGMVTLEVDYRDDELLVELRDDGASFDLDAVPAPKLAELPESGLGVFIIRACMDDLCYLPGSPNVLRMRKRLARTPEAKRARVGVA
jgi:serine/threonine-protein kinase RsbW